MEGEMRVELHARTFNRLKLFLGYEGRCRGAVLIEGDLCSSSQPCSACGHCEDANRKSQEKLGGVRCGFEANADFHAALKLKAGGQIVSALMFWEEADASHQEQAIFLRGQELTWPT
ncbi:transposase [Chthonomonas calidirosea]|uniref:Transposase and inactivated derivatives n=2 Tax=Chthonomonas TaxID=1077265 RepID=S0ETC2_CHTCT|nr:Transposase and inactivated derivatives [Chthonomonas calidirosea T49]CEK15054.1 transposase [Chthonomonas calidirosea]